MSDIPKDEELCPCFLCAASEADQQREDWVEWAFEHRVSQRSLEAISSILKGCVGKKPYENMWSSPAIGKSDILNQLAAEEGWPLYEISWGPRGYTALKSRIKGAWHDLRCGLAKWIAPDV